MNRLNLLHPVAQVLSNRRRLALLALAGRLGCQVDLVVLLALALLMLALVVLTVLTVLAALAALAPEFE